MKNVHVELVGFGNAINNGVVDVRHPIIEWNCFSNNDNVGKVYMDMKGHFSKNVISHDNCFINNGKVTNLIYMNNYDKQAIKYAEANY